MTEQSSISQEIPTHKNALEEKYQSIKTKEPLGPDNIKSASEDLPEPSGWRILILPFTPPERTKGGLILSQDTLDRGRITTNVGYVLKLGPLAYQDEEKFKTGPWCKEKDWVIFARYAGSRLPIEGGELRILNDDEVLGTVKDPSSIITQY
jgi:co-chaperonin GroES (HSP10)